MRAQSAYQRVVETTRTEYNGGPRMPDADSYEYGRFGEVMRMIQAGKCDEEIADRFPEFLPADQRGVLKVCRKIADGSVSKGHAIMFESKKPRTQDGLYREIVAGEMNGETIQEIARRLGMDANRLRNYARSLYGLKGVKGASGRSGRD